MSSLTDKLFSIFNTNNTASIRQSDNTLISPIKQTDINKDQQPILKRKGSQDTFEEVDLSSPLKRKRNKYYYQSNLPSSPNYHNNSNSNNNRNNNITHNTFGSSNTNSNSQTSLFNNPTLKFLQEKSTHIFNIGIQAVGNKFKQTKQTISNRLNYIANNNNQYNQQQQQQQQQYSTSAYNPYQQQSSSSSSSQQQQKQTNQYKYKEQVFTKSIYTPSQASFNSNTTKPNNLFFDYIQKEPQQQTLYVDRSLNIQPSPIHQYSNNTATMSQNETNSYENNNDLNVHQAIDEPTSASSPTNSQDDLNNNNNTINNNNNENDTNTTTTTTTTTTDNNNIYYTPKSKNYFIDKYSKQKQEYEFKDQIDSLTNTYMKSLIITNQQQQKEKEEKENQINNNSSTLHDSNYTSQIQQYTSTTTSTSIYQKSNSYLSPSKSINQQPKESPIKYRQYYEVIDDETDSQQQNGGNLLSLDDLKTSSYQYKSPSRQHQQHHESTTLSTSNIIKNNLISSLRPKPVELQDESLTQEFNDKLELQRKSEEDEEIQSLINKLHLQSQTSRWSITKQVYERREKEKLMKPKIRPLTDEENNQINRVMSKASTGNNTVLCKLDDQQLTSNDFTHLKPATWLNDEVINYYIQVLRRRQVDRPTSVLKCHFFNTFFYTMLTNKGYSYQRIKRWTNKVNLFELDSVIIPIHLGAHWCLAVINIKDKRFEYYDSLGGDNYSCLNNLAQYLKDEAKDKGKEGLIDIDSFENYIPKDIPQQNNGYDCGVFMCKFAEFSSRGASLTFTQKDITMYRRMMILECFNGQLLS